VPFDYDVKSDFVGDLTIDEAGEAILKFDVDTDAVPKVYPIGIEIRCTGDRDLGDDTVYIFNKEIKLEVTQGRSPKSSGIPGFEALVGLIALIFVFAVVARGRKRV
jgi:PGF-CTERM protein